MSVSRFRAAVSTKHLQQAGGVSLVESLHRPGSATGPHAHGSPRLCVVVAGSFVETDAGGSWTRGEGTVLLYPPEAEHDNHFSASGARCLNVEFVDPVTSRAAFTGSEVVRELGLRLSTLGMRLYDALRQGADRHAVASLVEALLRGVRDGKSTNDTDVQRTALHARRLIEEGAGRGITLSEVARALGVSRFALARLFRAETGLSVGDYRHLVLVRRARAALLTTDASLSAIAYRTGFADQSHFTRVFKRWTGSPPGRYRTVEY